MPRVNGVYQLPPGSEGVPNTTIQSNKYNTVLSDLASDANAKRPIGAGGTGGSTAVEANDALNTTSANMASAATLNLANATGVVVNVTGTTAITSLGTVNSGAERVLVFAAALTLTHNATSLILPGGANIVTAAGDVATFRSKGSGNWVCVGYQTPLRAELSLVNLKGADMASAATVNLANATGDFVNITGTTTITALGTVPAGAERNLVFAGVLTLTHNATSLILPGNANIVTAAGDVATVRSLGSGNWNCVNYVRGSGMPVPVATQAQAQAGTDNATVMTPLRVTQAISNTVSTLFYAGSGTPLETNFPIGHPVMAAASTTTLNTVVPLRAVSGAVIAYATGTGTNQLAGTWIFKGRSDGGNNIGLFVRVA